MADHSVAENIVNEVEYLQRMERAGVPEHLRDGLMRYFVHRIQPGHFLMAVLQNDLVGAIARGDDASRAGLTAIVMFLCHDVPAIAVGGPVSVRAWLDGGAKAEGRS